MSVRILVGDCRSTLRTLDEQSVHVCICSPPYYNLRRYSGDQQLVWGGDSKHNHEWGTNKVISRGGRGQNKGLSGTPEHREAQIEYEAQSVDQGQHCACGAWLGSLGNEETVAEYVAHLVECFREVHRVLRDDGTLWLNLGNSYSGSHGNGYKQTIHKTNYTSGEEGNFDLARQVSRNDAGWKPKDLIQIPFFVSEALREDGWYLRSVIPWAKPAALPESVRDRPPTAIEYFHLFTKTKHCYYDAQAIRVYPKPVNDQRKSWNPGKKFLVVNDDTGRTVRNDGLDALAERMNNGDSAGHSRRNSDWLLESLQGLILNEDDDPLCFVVSPTGYKGAHYAVFSEKLIAPIIKCSTSEYGVCQTCGNPWVREMSNTHYSPRIVGVGERNVDESRGDKQRKLSGAEYNAQVTRKTIGWQPDCSHNLPPIPATILDCFGGAGTTGLVADRLGRNAVVCELSEDYSVLSDNRLVSDSPMFADIEKVESVKPANNEYTAVPLFDNL